MYLRLKAPVHLAGARVAPRHVAPLPLSACTAFTGVPAGCCAVWSQDELRPKNAKRMRVQHTINTAGKMPRSFTQHSAHEARVLQYVQVCVGVWVYGSKSGIVQVCGAGMCGQPRPFNQVNPYATPHQRSRHLWLSP